MNGLSNTPASYLPSKRSQVASHNRIAKINELYEQKQKQHRDSVVSNNSTSVVSEDNCVPIHGLTSCRIQGQYNVDEPSTTVKHEELPNTSPTTKTNTHQEPVQNEKDNDDDDYEDELKFTPKLKSRRSLLTMRKNSEQESNSPISNENEVSPIGNPSTPLPRLRNRKISTRKSLGNPLPLPYLSNESHPIGTESTASPTLTSSNVDKKRQMMELKWKKLVAQDKAMLESRLEEMRKSALPTATQPSRPTSPTLLPTSVSPPLQSFEKLQQELINNRQKLDEIIHLLDEKQKTSLQFPFLKRYRHSSEIAFWTFCIIILILCNVYVYYYL